MKFLLVLALILFPKALNSAELSQQIFSMWGTKRELVEAWYFDEGTGTTTRGARGRSNGSITGAVVWVAGLHRNAIGFVNGTERMIFDTETLFDFIDIASTFTLVVVYKQMNEANTVPNGKFLAKQNGNAIGWTLIATTDLIGDFAFNHHDGTDLAKFVTGAVNVSTSCGHATHALVFDYSSRRPGM